nr:MAG TPA: hypothetical protein [Caudoviricetes sp.]
MADGDVEDVQKEVIPLAPYPSGRVFVLSVKAMPCSNFKRH